MYFYLCLKSNAIVLHDLCNVNDGDNISTLVTFLSPTSVTKINVAPKVTLVKINFFETPSRKFENKDLKIQIS